MGHSLTILKFCGITVCWKAP